MLGKKLHSLVASVVWTETTTAAAAAAATTTATTNKIMQTRTGMA